MFEARLPAFWSVSPSFSREEVSLEDETPFKCWLYVDMNRDGIPYVLQQPQEARGLVKQCKPQTSADVNSGATEVVSALLNQVVRTFSLGAAGSEGVCRHIHPMCALLDLCVTRTHQVMFSSLAQDALTKSATRFVVNIEGGEEGITGAQFVERIRSVHVRCSGEPTCVRSPRSDLSGRRAMAAHLHSASAVGAS